MTLIYQPSQRCPKRHQQRPGGAFTLTSHLPTPQQAPAIEATDTIDYVATDTWGNTATGTRTVIIDAATASTSTTPES
jgi:hypothetical protein